MSFPATRNSTAVNAVKPISKLAYVNALRGYAILGVILVHVVQFGSDKIYFNSLVNSITLQGARGVSMFFVFSAFTLFRSHAKRTDEKHPTRNFFIRRFFRIAPMYYVAVVLYSLWFIYLQPRPTITPTTVLANLTFMNGLSPYWVSSIVPGSWSISCEMLLYLCLPYLVTRIKSLDQSVRFIAVAILINSILSYLLTPLNVAPNTNLWSDFIFYYFPNQLPVFGFGILYFFIVTPTIESKQLKPATYLLATVAALSLLSTGLPYPTESITFPGQHYWFAAAFVLFGLALHAYAPKLLVNMLVNQIGEISFSIYLLHFAVLYGLQLIHLEEFIHPTRFATALLDSSIRYVVVLLVSAFFATITYYGIELQAQELGKWIISKLERE